MNSTFKPSFEKKSTFLVTISKKGFTSEKARGILVTVVSLLAKSLVVS